MLPSSSFVYCFLWFLWPAGRRRRSVVLLAAVVYYMSPSLFLLWLRTKRLLRGFEQSITQQWIIWPNSLLQKLSDVAPFWLFPHSGFFFKMFLSAANFYYLCLTHFNVTPSFSFLFYDRWIMPKFSTMSERALPSPPVCCLCACSQHWLTDWPRPRGSTTWPTSGSAWPCWPS